MIVNVLKVNVLLEGVMISKNRSAVLTEDFVGSIGVECFFFLDMHGFERRYFVAYFKIHLAFGHNIIDVFTLKCPQEYSFEKT
jgi:hypothetical protein